MQGFSFYNLLDNILVLTHTKHVGKKTWILLCSVLVHHQLCINVSKSGLHLTLHLGLCWDTVDMSVSLLSDKLLEIQSMAHTLLQSQPVKVHQVTSFQKRPPFLPLAMHNSTSCVVSFRVICWMFTILQIIYSFHLSLPAWHQLKATVTVAACFSPFAISSSWYGYCYRCYTNLVGLLFSRFWVSLSCSGPWSGFMCKAHIAL